MYIVDVKNPVGLQVLSFSYDVYTEVKSPVGLKVSSSSYHVYADCLLDYITLIFKEEGWRDHLM